MALEDLISNLFFLTNEETEAQRGEATCQGCTVSYKQSQDHDSALHS